MRHLLDLLLYLLLLTAHPAVHSASMSVSDVDCNPFWVHGELCAPWWFLGEVYYSLCTQQDNGEGRRQKGKEVHLGLTAKQDSSM